MRLNLHPAGAVDADLAQAVARYQRDEGGTKPVLAVDGKAGPNSTPRLFPSGLAKPGQSAEFGTAAQRDVFANWGTTLVGADDLADAIVKVVNQRLTEAGVPEVAVKVEDGVSPNTWGYVELATWTMYLNREPLDLSGLNSRDSGSLATTVYHEARYAEQLFWVARYLAGQGARAPGIASTLGIPGRVATHATAQPIRPGTTDALIASGWYESFFGSAKAHADEVHTRVSEADWAVITANCRCQQSPSPENSILLAEAEAAFRAVGREYLALPEENDAWATASKVGDSVTEGTPNPVRRRPVDPCEQLRQAGRPVPAAPGGSGR